MASSFTPFVTPGPYPVGLRRYETTVTCNERQLPLYVWYPAASIDSCENAQDILPAHASEAFINAPSQLGPHWLILFSHGNGGMVSFCIFFSFFFSLYFSLFSFVFFFFFFGCFVILLVLFCCFVSILIFASKKKKTCTITST